jgi:hypothetical protein
MSKPNFNDLQKRLRPEDKDKLNRICQELLPVKTANIEREIDNDNNHLALVNFCAKLFQPQIGLSLKTGYTLISYDPLYGLHIKNFDMAILKPISGSERNDVGLVNTGGDSKGILILVDCKSSISDPKGEIKDFLEKINETMKSKALLEERLGCRINAFEFVICTTTLDALKISEVVFQQNIPIIIWAVDLFKGEIQLIHSNEGHDAALRAGRTHRDESLSRNLETPFKARMKNLPIAPMVPSSHPCILLTHVVCDLIHILETTGKSYRSRFGISDVLHVLQDAFRATTLTDEEKFNKADEIIGLGLRKEIFEDVTPQIRDIREKEYYMKINPKRIGKVKDNYINLNAQKKADEESVEVFLKSSAGRGILNHYFEKEK